MNSNTGYENRFASPDEILVQKINESLPENIGTDISGLYSIVHYVLLKVRLNYQDDFMNLAAYVQPLGCERFRGTMHHSNRSALSFKDYAIWDEKLRFVGEIVKNQKEVTILMTRQGLLDALKLDY